MQKQIAQPTGGPARVANAVLGERSHLCAFFASEEDEYEIMLPFIKEGLERGEKAFHTLDPDRVQDHVQRMVDASIDVDRYRRSNQLELRSWDDVYLMSGTFVPEATGAVFKDVQADAEKGGYQRTRFIGQMDWLTRRMDKVDDLLINEARWTAEQHNMPPAHVVCMYDLRKYRADIVIDVMRTHPQVIVGRTAYENPFFVAPEDFIREIEGRANKSRFEQS